MFNFYDVDIYGANQYRSVGYSSGGKFDAMRNIGSGAGFESIDDDGFTIMLALGQYYGGDIMVTAAE